MANTIEVKDLYFSYEPGHSVIQGASFSISAGSYTTIIGHNGSGKSTLAKLLAGLLDKESGSIRIQGKEMSEERLDEIRSQIGIVFQNPDNQFIGSTVRDDIAFGLENHQVEPMKMEAIIKDNAQRVGMSASLDQAPMHLSGGQKQRVAVARAIITQPDLLLADEPTGALDSHSSAMLLDLFQSLNKAGQTILMVTHSTMAASKANRILFIRDGHLFHQLYRGDLNDEELYKRISDTITLMSVGGEQHV